MRKSFMRALALVLALVLAMSMVLAGCGDNSNTQTNDNTNSSDTQTSTNGGSDSTVSNAASDTLTWVLTGDIQSLDPTQAYDDITNMVVNQITEGLLNFDANNKIVCTLAESWECVDPLTYV